MSNTLLMKTKKTERQRSGLELLFAHIPGVILEFDTELQCIRYNRPSSKNFTSTEGSFLEGRILSDLLVEENRKAGIIGIFDLVKESGEPRTFVSITNDSVHLTTTINPLFEDEKLIGYVSVCQEREPVTDGDQRSQIFDGFNDTALILNAFGEILRSNKPFMGLPQSALEGKNIADFFEQEDMMVVRAALLRVTEDSSSLCFENQASVSGTPRWFSNSVSPYHSENGKAVEVLMLSREISSLKNKIWELGKERQFQENVVNNITDGVIAIDVSGRVTVQNPVALEIFGQNLINIDDLRTTKEITLLDPANGEVIPFENTPLIQALRGVLVDQEECLVKLNSEPNIRHITWTARPIMVGDFDIKGAVVVMRDSTKEKQATEKLVKANANLDAFVKTTAHDLKSPVLNMRHLLKLISQIEPGDKRELLIEKLDSSAVKLDDLLSALMDWVDAQRNNEDIIEKIELEEIYDSVIEDLQPDITTSGAIIQADFSESPWISYNGVHLRSIFFNLLSNAIKYRSPDRDLLVDVTSKPDEMGNILIEVTDNGQGIDMRFYAEEIFKPFRRLTSKGEGKGIGLNLIRNFAERNGGEVRVESKKGEGSIFTVVLCPYADI